MEFLLPLGCAFLVRCDRECALIVLAVAPWKNGRAWSGCRLAVVRCHCDLIWAQHFGEQSAIARQLSCCCLLFYPEWRYLQNKKTRG